MTTTTKCYCKNISRNVVIARKITESVRFSLFLAELLQMALKRPGAYPLAQRVKFRPVYHKHVVTFILRLFIP